MTRWLRHTMGVASLTVGGSLLFWNATTIDRSLSTTTQGLPLLNFIGVVLGLAALGASAEFFGLVRRSDTLPKIRNTKVYGSAEPASEWEAKAAANGGVRAPLHDRIFSD